MKIRIWGINYWPEVTGIAPCNTAWAEHFVGAGHEVEMVTTFPYYPSWRKRVEDRWKWFADEVVRGVRVVRCWHYVPARPKAVSRILHELTFVFVSLWRQLWMARADVLVVVSPPLLLGWAAAVLGGLKKMPFVFHVQDLQPDAAAGLGMVRPGVFLGLLYGLEKAAYRNASKISCIHARMADAIAGKGVAPEKISVNPNGLSDWGAPAAGERDAMRAKLGVGAGETLLVYSGNLGKKQGLDFLVSIMRELAGKPFRLVISGDGADRENLVAQARPFPETISMAGLLPEAEHRALLWAADIALVCERADAAGCFLPSKILSYLNARRPVAAFCRSGSPVAEFIDGHGVGMWSEYGDAAAAAAVLEAMKEPGQLKAWGQKAGEAVSEFGWGAVAGRALEDVVAAGRQ